MKLRRKELVLLSELRTNSRKNLVELSKSTGIPVSTIFEKMKRDFDGAIEKYSLVLNFDKMGFTARALVFLKVSKDDRKKLQDYLIKYHFSNNVYKVNNGFDFIVDLVVPHFYDIDTFLDELNSDFDIINSEIHYVTSHLSSEHLLSSREQVDLIHNLLTK